MPIWLKHPFFFFFFCLSLQANVRSCFYCSCCGVLACSSFSEPAGNICRSPTAEAVFRHVVEGAGLENRFEIDSCGTGGGNPDWYRPGGWSYHEGDESDPRMAVAGTVLARQEQTIMFSDSVFL